MPTCQAKGKEVQILVRTVLNLQKDLLKYTKALHPDIPVKPQSQRDGSKVVKADIEALSDDQLREITAYYMLDKDERDIDIDELIDSMLGKAKLSEKTTSTPAISKVEISNQPSPSPKAVPVRLKVQSRKIESQQPGINFYAHGDSGYDPSTDHDKQNPEYGSENPP